MTAQDLATRDTQQPLSVQMREQLILEHLPQVKLIARRIHERLPVSVSLDDLISTGVLGLIAAIDRYDASHDVKLKTYAEYKIRGAILDSLRGLDWAPRQQRKRSKQIEAAIAALEQEHQRTPTEEEIAAHLGLSISDYQDWLTEIRGLTLGVLEKPHRGRRMRSAAVSCRHRRAVALSDRRKSRPRTAAGRGDRENAATRAHRFEPLLLRGNDVA